MSSGKELILSPETVAALKGHVARLDSFKSTLIYLDSLYVATRSLAADIQKISVCKQGCSHCCKLNVDISEIEADYINDKLEAIKPDLAVKLSYSKGFDSGSFCPFHDHDTKSCNIYEFRPVVCQMFASVDSPTFCETPDIPHEITTLYSSKPVVKMLSMVDDVGGKDGLPKYADIREWFKKAR